jgi:predicted nucleotide-binding protein
VSKELELLESLRDEVEDIRFLEEEKRDATIRHAKMLARKIFGENSKYIEDIKHIRFKPVFLSVGMNDEQYRPAWDRGKARLLNLVNTMIEEVSIFGSEDSGSPIVTMEQAEELVEESIFIVHGRDEELKQAVARAVEMLGLKAIILHEQPNEGRTIIEKFMDYGQVASFAIVLLSPDDVAYSGDEEEGKARFRARQNVILELGFFTGKLGRSRVLVIHGEAEKFEMPSDYSGVLFVPYDQKGTWRFELVRELKAAGYKADANVFA